MPRLTRARVTTIAVLLAVVALGTALRLIPSWRGSDRYPVSDPMFHLRMTRVVSDRWQLPRVDSLACAPVGREVGRLLPTGLYWAAGAFHRAAAAIDYRDLLTHARVFVALAGALVALPVYGATRELHRGRAPALVAALVAVILPAHLHRSFGYWFRYDALGTLLIATHVALSLAAFAATARTRARVASAGAALALVAALAVWRVALTLRPRLRAPSASRGCVPGMVERPGLGRYARVPLARLPARAVVRPFERMVAGDRSRRGTVDALAET
jgi:asparagine N-glycosylation enzyme membrane subunit Stt3